MIESPLGEIHDSAISLAEVDGMRLAARFGEVSDEYAAFRVGASLVDCSHLGRVEQAGADAVDLLHRLTTNDIASLPAGSARQTILASELGRVLDVFTVVRRGGRPLLLLTSGAFKSSLMEKIDFYTITEDSSLTDISGSTAQLAICGPEARRVMTNLAGASTGGLADGQHIIVGMAGATVLVIRMDTAAGLHFDMIMDSSCAPAVWRAAVEAGALPTGTEAAEAYRIECGIPVASRDFDARVNPLEAGFMDLIAFDKGCYIGQEVIARLDTYDKVQRRLVGLSADGALAEGDALLDGEREIGWAGSVAESPAFEGLIGLGYVRNRYAVEGTVLQTPSGAMATVRDLPMVP